MEKAKEISEYVDETLDIESVRRILKTTVRRLVNRQVDVMRLYEKVSSLEDLYNPALLSKAYVYSHGNVHKQEALGKTMNSPHIDMMRDLARRSLAILLRGGDPEAGLVAELQQNKDDPLNSLYFFYQAQNKAEQNTEYTAWLGHMLAIWMVDRASARQSGRPEQEIAMVSGDQLLTFIQILSEKGELKDPCSGLNQETGLCDIYPVRPAVCDVTGNEYAPQEPAIAGCGQNLAHCLVNKLMFANLKRFTREIANESSDAISLDMLLFYACVVRLMREPGAVKPVMRKDFARL